MRSCGRTQLCPGQRFSSRAMADRYTPFRLYPEHTISTLSPDWRTQPRHVRFRKSWRQKPLTLAQLPETTSCKTLCAVKTPSDTPEFFWMTS